MSVLMDIHGRRYRLATWHAKASNAIEQQKMQSEQDSDHLGTVGFMKKVIVDDETGELVTGLIDLGEGIIASQKDGCYTYEMVVSAQSRLQ